MADKPNVTIYATLAREAIDKHLKWFDSETPPEGQYAHAHELIAPRAMESLRLMMEHVLVDVYAHGLQDGFIQGVEREAQSAAKPAIRAERERERILKFGTILSEAQKRRLNKNEPPFVPDHEGDSPGPAWFNGDWPAKAYAYQERQGSLLER